LSFDDFVSDECSQTIMEVPQMQPTTAPPSVIERMRDAINAHDLDVLAACFAPDYASEFPAHPDRAFRGIEPMRRNWTQIFAGVPDLAATLLRCTADGETVWAEWEWQGARADGAPFAMRGVTIQGVRDDRVVWARLYMEPVQEGGAGNAAAIRAGIGGRGPA
jgi:ketosteroid isomerase-like protein